MNILSIQSHVNYGYVGNKAATFPLQSLGFEVWPINTVQFSNHTGYGSWQGEIFSAEHIRSLVKGLEALGLKESCNAILSGYLGDITIGQVILETVQRFKKANSNLIYLCDPVMGSAGKKACVVKKSIPFFFRDNAINVADIITPNHVEAEILYEKEIKTEDDLKQASSFFHQKGIKIVIITRLKLNDCHHLGAYSDFLSIKNGAQYLAITPRLEIKMPPNGSGDLFSALYLGHFLLTKNPIHAFKYAINSTHKIIAETIKSGQRELKIINNYRDQIPDVITFIPLKQ